MKNFFAFVSMTIELSLDGYLDLGNQRDEFGLEKKHVQTTHSALLKNRS